MDLLVRLILVVFVGIAGWIVIGLVGAFTGAALDLLLRRGADDTSLAWGLGMVGGLLGLIGAPMWLAVRMRRDAS
jgi:hypothetical protein